MDLTYPVDNETTVFFQDANDTRVFYCLLSIKECLKFPLWPLSVVQFNYTPFGVLPLVCCVFLSCFTTISDTADITFCASKNDMI